MKTSREIRQEQAQEAPERKLTRKERREFGRKMQKPKYQKIAKRIIDSKTKS